MRIASHTFDVGNLVTTQNGVVGLVVNKNNHEYTIKDINNNIVTHDGHNIRLSTDGEIEDALVQLLE